MGQKLNRSLNKMDKGGSHSKRQYMQPTVSNVGAAAAAALAAGVPLGENNNLSATANNNGFMPMLSKYGSFDPMNAAFLASFQNLGAPFYPMVDPRNPYSIQRLLELTGASHNVGSIDLLGNGANGMRKATSLHSDPEDMIEEVTEDVSDENNSKLAMDLNDDESAKERIAAKRECPSPSLSHDSQMPSPRSPDVKFNGKYEEQRDIKPTIDELKCSQCDETFNHRTELAQHENVLCRMVHKPDPVLRVASAESLNINSNYTNNNLPVHSGSEDDVERKVRVRTAISEEQQNILKDYYAVNPRPNRDEFRTIAQQLMLDSRVVQVWFQNNRSRERKIKNISYLKQQQQSRQKQQQQSHTAYAAMNGTAGLSARQTLTSPIQNSRSSPAFSHGSLVDDQPLDLSVKRESSSSSTPASSPRYGTALVPSHDEVMNLSRKSMPQYPFFTSAALGLVPMDRLMHISPEMTRGAVMGILASESVSPKSEKRPWRPNEDFNDADEGQAAQTQQLPPQPPQKRSYVKQETEGEGQFICDQCDKAFNKQSSLARHKYEHSGKHIPPYSQC